LDGEQVHAETAWIKPRVQVLSPPFPRPDLRGGGIVLMVDAGHKCPGGQEKSNEFSPEKLENKVYPN
jgi:hypothetical protein